MDTEHRAGKFNPLVLGRQVVAALPAAVLIAARARPGMALSMILAAMGLIWIITLPVVMLKDGAFTFQPKQGDCHVR